MSLGQNDNERTLPEIVEELKKMADNLKGLKEDLYDIPLEEDYSEFRSAFVSIASLLNEMAQGIESNFMAQSYINEKCDAIHWSLTNWCKRKEVRA